MFFRRFKRCVFLGMLSILLLMGVAVVLANPLEGREVYLPLVLAKYPPPPSNTVKLLITEVSYNPTLEPSGEWVELYNPGNGSAILAEYKLGDEETYGSDEGMLQFPIGAILDPGEVVVVANKGVVFRDLYGFSPDYEMNDTDPTIPDMLMYHAWSTGKVELLNAGDEVLLLDGNDNLVDALSWADSTWENAFDPPPLPAGDSASLERSPAYNDTDSAADWVVAETPGPHQLDLSPLPPTATPTPEIPTGPTILLISEVLYDPSGDDPAGEWIEIYNAGENNALLSTYRLGDEETQGAGEGMYHFPDGAVLLSGETAVIANQSIVFEALYGFKPDFEISDTDPEIPDMQPDPEWASGSMNMSASGDDVLILDVDNSLVDGVSWGSSAAMLDPAVPDVDPDHSIERYPPATDTDTASDWRDQPNPVPNQLDFTPPTLTPSPTATSLPEPLPDLIINEIHADPDGDNGDANGDGDVDSYDDEFIEIVNTTESDIAIGGWEIYDAVGVRHVFSNTTTIPAGCAIVVFGDGTPTGSFGNAIVQLSSTGSLGLNNSGDTLILYDLSSTAVYSYTYGTEGGDNQSITRDPDITGPDPMIKHSTATGSNGVLFSPGTRIDSSSFAGCSTVVTLKKSTRTWAP